MKPLAIRDGALHVPEADIQRAVIDLLELSGWMPIRTHAGLAKSLDGKRHINLGPKGRPDLLAVKPFLCAARCAVGLGRVVFIETKTATGRLSKDQKAWRAWLIGQGYEHLVARDVRDVQAWLRGAK